MINLKKYGKNISITYILRSVIMNDINMKNMVVLKNLPSNIVDEAFVVFKSSKKIKNVEKVEQNKKVADDTENKNKDYFLKEAEMLVNDYIYKIEKNEKDENISVKHNKRLKFWAFISTGIAVLEWFVLINK